MAYYSTYIVGQAAERYLAQGKSWGEGGPKHVVREILDSLDRDSILAQARADEDQNSLVADLQQIGRASCRERV